MQRTSVRIGRLEKMLDELIAAIDTGAVIGDVLRARKYLIHARRFIAREHLSRIECAQHFGLNPRLD